MAVGLAIIAYGSGDTEGASIEGDLVALAVSALFAAGLTSSSKGKACFHGARGTHRLSQRVNMFVTVY